MKAAPKFELGQDILFDDKPGNNLYKKFPVKVIARAWHIGGDAWYYIVASLPLTNNRNSSNYINNCNWFSDYEELENPLIHSTYTFLEKYLSPMNGGYCDADEDCCSLRYL